MVAQGVLEQHGHVFRYRQHHARAALAAFERRDGPFCGSTDSRSAGNGSLMRLAPVPLFFALQPEDAIAMAADSSRTTHGAEAAIDACRYFAGLIVGALQGVSKEQLLALRFSPVPGLWERNPLCAEIDDIARGAFRRRTPPEIRGTGYVVHTLEAALWAFDRARNFRDGCLRVVNLGDDADTTGAVFGQLAGAYYGEGGIPFEWRARLHAHGMIASIADRICQRCG